MEVLLVQLLLLGSLCSLLLGQLFAAVYSYSVDIMDKDITMVLVTLPLLLALLW